MISLGIFGNCGAELMTFWDRKRTRKPNMDAPKSQAPDLVPWYHLFHQEQTLPEPGVVPSVLVSATTAS
jgi:hypothetical protein